MELLTHDARAAVALATAALAIGYPVVFGLIGLVRRWRQW